MPNTPLSSAGTKSVHPKKPSQQHTAVNSVIFLQVPLEKEVFLWYFIFQIIIKNLYMGWNCYETNPRNRDPYRLRL